MPFQLKKVEVVNRNSDTTKWGPFKSRQIPNENVVQQSKKVEKTTLDNCRCDMKNINN